jgi:hypothetical protein
MDRIQINGEWYIKESAQQSQTTDTDNLEQVMKNSICEYNVCSYEDDEIAIECHYDKDPPSVHHTPAIEFLDKKRKGVRGTPEYWDGTGWMWGVYENNPESLEEIEEFGIEYIPRIRAFIKYMVDENILRKQLR